ncbi:peptidylprolyl isomerase [Marinifilum caeruleilacunae]|uniref:PpiC domain-containing protein n=1 Tax=Marinifilum caeruleilacunae TaxID=2499076 RepID=A0ABX1WTZ4_9BACT|nr:peptidylprolyl isomerase [Marinifilum caeruleilacunae]NOU59431.1 hypothetical protein [Marinifilum caeruleilacunae]
MRKGLLYLITVLYCSLASYGQYSTTDTLFSINNQAYPSAPFKDLFESKKLRGTDNKALPLNEALDLYIDYQLKAREAKNLRLDTIPEIAQEIESYHNQAFNTYLYPVEISDKLIEETFNRLQHFIKVRHILIKIEGRETPKDTLEAYQAALKIYTQLNKGRKFEKLASLYSDDMSVRKNDGEIGYISVFDMDYAFESAAYDTEFGKYSKPVRSPYGYHIVQAMERIENPGRVKIKHLMLEFKKKNAKDEIKLKADSLYQLLQKGADFSEMVLKHSDDINSAKDSGNLPWFGLFETHPAIEKAAFNLKNKGDYSTPIKTEFGYHIIQLLDKKEHKSLEQSREEITSRLEDDSRSRKSERELIRYLKEKYKYQENKQLLENFYSILDYAYAELWEALFTIDGKDYSQEKFAEFLSKQESKDIYENFKEYINRLYVNFSNTCILAYHKKKLEEQYPELRSLLREYENAVLVYFISKNKIWDKASANEKEVKEFYQQNLEKYESEVGFEESKDKVLRDYREYLGLEWSKELRKKYAVSINKPTLIKIANKQNE